MSRQIKTAAIPTDLEDLSSRWALWEQKRAAAEGAEEKVWRVEPPAAQAREEVALVKEKVAVLEEQERTRVTVRVRFADEAAK
jgi:hypothetical protein